MDQHNHSDTSDTTPQPTTTPVATPAVAASTNQLLIPISILMAGAFVAIGLFFGLQSMNSGGPQIVSQLDARIFTLAEAAGVDRDELIECLASGEMSQVVEADSQNALETGGRGTPWSIVIGPNGTYPINGALPPEAVNQILDAARSGAELPVDPEAPELNTDAVTPLSDTDYRKGPADATLTIVEYSDFDCTFCSRFHSSMQQVINTNDDVAWVYRHFPLDQIHPDARRVAEASECVGALGGDEAFWSFTDGYFGV